MEAIFLKILNMSITASWLILGAMLVRFLFKKAPKSLRFIIWALVGARLILPFSFESAFSLIRSPEPIPQDIVISADPQINSGIGALNSFINPIITETLAPQTPAVPQTVPSPTPVQSLTHTLSIIWICVMAAMLGYAAVTYLILRRRVRASVKTDGGAYICDGIDSPFVLGIIKPRIYLPSNLDERQAEHVLAHEKAHIRRRDHWWKSLSFMLLSVYWFNPLIWAAYVLLCRDIELACDERVARGMSDGERADYSSTLLELSIPRRMITACPVAFGEVSVKSRIRSVLSYKKPTLWIIIAALVACAVLTVTLFANPVSKEDEKDEPKQEEKDEPIKDEKEENKPDITPEWDTKYAAADSKDAVTPYFCLNEAEKRYIFVYSGFSSHISEGSYELIGQDLIMLEDETEREYVFHKTEDCYSFDAAASSPMPEYKYSADSEPEVCIEDGTLFCLNSDENAEDPAENTESYALLYNENGVVLYSREDRNGAYSGDTEFTLQYNGKIQDFTGRHNRAFDSPTVYVEDLTGDGTDEITVIMPYGQGMGLGCNLDVHVFNSADLSQYSFTPIADIIAQNTEFSSNEKAFYIELNGKKYSFDRGEHTSPELQIATENWNNFTVSDSKLRCETYCYIVAPVYTLASLHTEYRFDGEKFVFGSMTIEPHEEYTIEDERTPETAVPAAKPSRAPETNVNTNTNANIDTPAPAPEPEEQTSGHTASGVPNNPENTSLQIGGVSSYYDDFEFGRTYGYFSDEKVYEPRNHDVPFNSEIGEEQDESGVTEPSVEIISLIP